MTQTDGDLGSPDGATAAGVNWTDANQFTFDECDCEQYVPDPVAYDLPDGRRVEIIGCADCGAAIDWATKGQPTVEELREVARQKQATIDDLREQVESLQDELDRQEQMHEHQLRDELSLREERIQELQSELQAKESEIERLRADQPTVEPPVESSAVSDATIADLKRDHDDLAEHIESLEADLEEATGDPLFERARALLGRVPTPSTQSLATAATLGITLSVGFIVFDTMQPAVAETSRGFEVALTEIPVSSVLLIAALAFCFIVVLNQVSRQ